MYLLFSLPKSSFGRGKLVKIVDWSTSSSTRLVTSSLARCGANVLILWFRTTHHHDIIILWFRQTHLHDIIILWFRMTHHDINFITPKRRFWKEEQKDAIRISKEALFKVVSTRFGLRTIETVTVTRYGEQKVAQFRTHYLTKEMCIREYSKSGYCPMRLKWLIRNVFNLPELWVLTYALSFVK